MSNVFTRLLRLPGCGARRYPLRAAASGRAHRTHSTVGPAGNDGYRYRLALTNRGWSRSITRGMR